MKIALITNFPAPYRVPIYDRIGKHLGHDFKAIYMTELESNRLWHVPVVEHDHVYLKGFTLRLNNERHIHIRFATLRRLKCFNPDVVITVGFNPPMLFGWLYTQLFRKKHVAMSDAWIGSEAHLSAVHRIIRRLVYKSSVAFIGASEKTLELFKSYGVRRNLFKSCLCIDSNRFKSLAGSIVCRPYDLVYSGRIIEGKLPMFFVEVVRSISEKNMKLSVLVVGDGVLRIPMQAAISSLPNVNATFTGYLQQDELPAHYTKGKIFCFPTRRDAWGLVANEACAAGMAVLTCSNAGCANELVVHGYNGYVLPLDVENWAEHIARLLLNEALLIQMSNNATESVEEYNYDQAALGMIAACEATI
jgi:glycosyltransferase involved in cell wall biosynthesis